MMAFVIDDLLNDVRLTRLFSTDARNCALQLWILQINSEKSIENRVIYGRLLPYNHSNDRWSAKDDDDFKTFGEFQAQVVRLNLYIKSTLCAALLRALSVGKTIAEVSLDLNIGLSEKLKERFGTTALKVSDLAYRPVTYQLNRDAHDQFSLSSPHGSAGAFSASIIQVEKGALFRLNHGYDIALTAWVVEQLNADIGLNFGDIDGQRFGELELQVFPTLDDWERRLLSVSWVNARPSLIARFSPTQLPHFNKFQFRLNVANNAQIFYSSIVTAQSDSEGVFASTFEFSEQLSSITGSIELEIFGFHGEASHEGTLCCRYRVSYFREVSITSHVANHGGNPVRFDWLEKVSRPSLSPRVKAALTINRGNLSVTSRVGGNRADAWVLANNDLSSLFARLHPPKSEGRFFLRWSQGDGDGRLEFVEWFKALLAKYQQHQLIIFDPYFEDAGLGLLLLSAAEGADYIVFTALPKPSKDIEATPRDPDNPASSWTNYLVAGFSLLLKRTKLRIFGLRDGCLCNGDALLPMPSKEGEAVPGDSDKPAPSRINNLVASCEHNRQLLKSIKLRIYGLKEGRLHDRYILITGADGLPVAGFNLSNSFQKAAENYPLLVTPIPADTLLKVEQYKAGLVAEARAMEPEGKAENPALRLLFDSTASPTAPRRYEPLSFLDKAQSGDVLSVWTGEPSLQGLSGPSLRERMAMLDLIKEDSLALSDVAGMHNCLVQQAGNFSDFRTAWEVLGDILAHSHAGDHRFAELESECDFLEFLALFLDSSFNRTHDEVNKQLAVVDAQFFRKSIDTLLHSSYHPSHLFHATKYTALTWPEYFTIKFLWWYAPDDLLAMVEAQAAKMPTEPQGPDVVRLSLLSQIVSEIALSVQFDISKRQRDRLVCSSNGLLQWMGLTAIEMQLEKPAGLATVLQLVDAFSYQERVRALGWMVHHASKNPKKADIYNGLVVALHEALPKIISAKELRCLIDCMRGHMHQLSWTEPWLFQDVVFPLLENDRANIDDACEIWIQELNDLLDPELNHRSLLFDRLREGQTTNVTAFIFARSSPTRQKASLKSIQAILKRQKRILQQPLASTSDSARWDSALVVSMWILIFVRWGQYYLPERSIAGLDELALDAYELAMVRPMAEWRLEGAGTQGELAAYLDQVEELLTSNEPEL